MRFRLRKETLAVLTLVFSVNVNAAEFTGTITWMEVWRNGNIAFKLSDSASASSCNGQFILNASDAGARNQYAVLLAAKLNEGQVQVNTYACGQADSYGGNYNIVEYLYPL